ncbi:MAG: transporter substrate-binding protein [Paenibacillus sp.]|nr:transporter substrate-binding protein [Paenibacillus sp.]
MKPGKMIHAGLNVIMVLSFVMAGCSGNTPSNDKTPGDGDSASQAANKAVFPPKEKVTLKIVGVRHQSITVDYNEMPLFQQLEQKSNVHINWNLLSGDVSKEKMNLIFATNDLPDAFFGPSTIEDVAAQTDITKQLIPLNKLIDEYAPNVKDMFKQEPMLKNLVTQENGNIYYLPMKEANPSQAIPSAMFINKKWLDELGLPIPQTIDELENVLKAFKDKDPNHNGKADEIPFSFRPNDHIQGPESLAIAFGKGLPSGNANRVYVENGKVSIAPSLKENKDYYVWLNKLNKQGLIDPEVFTQNANVFQAKLQSKTPIIGVFFGWSESWAFGKENPDYVPLLPPKGPGGHQGWNVQSDIVKPKSFSITTANKHPEITMAWVDQFYSEKGSIEASYGPIDLLLKKDGDKYVYNTPPQGMTLQDWTNKNVPTFYAARYLSQDRFDKVQKSASAQEKLSLTNTYRPFVPKEYYPSAVPYNKQDQDRLDKWNTDVFAKNALYEVSYAKMLNGDNPEKTWEDMVAKMKQLGLDEVTSLYQKYYDQLKK